MAQQVSKVLITGAAGYVASQLLPTFRERYDTVLLDATTSARDSAAASRSVDRQGNHVEGVEVVDLLDPDRSNYERYFQGVDAVVHLARKPTKGDDQINFFIPEKQNVEMAHNVLRAAYDAGVPRVAVASSNHAADWYEDALIHERKMEMVEPYMLPLSSQFYGWAKATTEHVGFLFACGTFGRKLEVVMLRIGAPRPLDLSVYDGDPVKYKRDLGAYLSPRDLTQLVTRAIETPDIENEHGIPWQVVYGISNNTRAFWSLSNARAVLGYEPEDDSEVVYADDIRGFLIGDGATGGIGRVGIS